MEIRDTESKLELSGLPDERIKFTITLSVIVAVFTPVVAYTDQASSRTTWYIFGAVLIAILILQDLVASRFFKVLIEPNRF